MRIYPILIGIAIALCVCVYRTKASDSDPFFNARSPECQFLAGAWEGYVAGLTASADKDAAYKTNVAIWFHRLQRGLPANVRAYENLKQELSDTAEHKALFLQVENDAKSIEKAFVKQFSKPTKLGFYRVGPEWRDEAGSNIVLSVSLTNAVFHANDEIVVDVTYSNRSDVAVAVDEGSLMAKFGDTKQEGMFNMVVRASFKRGVKTITLQPGEQYTDILTLMPKKNIEAGRFRVTILSTLRQGSTQTVQAGEVVFEIR